jgi:large subunit ribosomal protein L31
MKKDIHPKYNDDAKISCACGNVIKTGSTVKSMEIEICSACHPFFTGKKRVVDSAGQVDRFKKRMEKASQLKQEKEEAAAKKKEVAKKGKAKTVKETLTKQTKKK